MLCSCQAGLDGSSSSVRTRQRLGVFGVVTALVVVRAECGEVRDAHRHERSSCTKAVQQLMSYICSFN